MAPSTEYNPLQTGLLANASYADSEVSEDEKTYLPAGFETARPQKRRSLRTSVLLTVSVLVNLALAGYVLLLRQQDAPLPVSKFGTSPKPSQASHHTY